MRQITVESRGSVVLARLNRGVTNTLNLACVEESGEVIQQVRGDPDVRALVVASSNDKFFSIGFDIPELFELSKDRFAGFYRAFNRASLDLYTLPKPTVAAIAGHAIAGGGGGGRQG